jgi:tetratricopeptide (TPR) repeat protein
MAMFGQSIGSFHNDVLHAQPTDDASRWQLINEIKNRAKGSIGSRNFPEAITLYNKAIEICPVSEEASGDQNSSKEKAILFANRSMCWFSMKKFLDAESDASEAIKLDGSYVKAYYRKTVALVGLNRLSEAREAVRAGLTLKPDDKELLAQLAAVESAIAKGGSAADTGSSKSSASTSSATKTVAASSSSKVENKPSSSSVASADPAKKTDGMQVVEEDEEEGTFRGYKKREDGRVTTFFNHDLDETVGLFHKWCPVCFVTDFGCLG